MAKSSDFQFWEENLPLDHQVCADDWAGVDFRRETACLWTDNCSYSCQSPTSQWQAIADGRKKIMEMIKDMPESSNELSLKYMVDDQQNNEDVQVKEVIVEEEKNVKRKTVISIPQVNRYPKGRQICRTESMESEAVLLKMFLPVSLSFKKKSTAGKRQTISSSPCERSAAKKWWKIIARDVKCNRNNEHIIRSTSDISRHRTSSDESTLICCRHSLNKKPKSRRQRGCLF